MRVAWFSPLPPAPTGIASYSAEILPLLRAPGMSIDAFVDQPTGTVAGSAAADADRDVFDAHDFVWKQQREPYDLVVYQLGNARWHDYMWAYLVAYPGLVVLHDTRLHHARARHLLSQGRQDDYRREFRYDHPAAPAGVEEYAVEGLSGSLYYFWSMLPVVLRTARLVAVHNARVAYDLREEHAGIRIDTLRMGVPSGRLPGRSAADASVRLRRDLGIPGQATVFVAFGHLTVEKRIEPVLRALETLVANGIDAHLVLVGQAERFPSLYAIIDQRGLAGRVHVTGFVADADVAGYLALADACLCLRWPTAGETSAAWLRALAAARPTIVTGLAHLADVPTVDASTWRPSHPPQPPVAVSVDLLDEHHALTTAMTRIAGDAQLRDELARAGHAYWSREHALDLMASDYRRLLRDAAGRPAPRVDHLPPHFTGGHTETADRLIREMDLADRGVWNLVIG